MTGRLLPTLASMAVLIWIGVVAMSAITNWPHIPLDMGGKDPVLAAAYQKAVTAHVLRAVLMAAVPAIAVGLLLFTLRRRHRS